MLMFYRGPGVGRKHKAARRAHALRFVPSDPTGTSVTRLETRALAIPAFYRFPLGSTQDNGQAVATAQVFGNPTVVDSQMFNANASKIVTAGTGTMTSTSTANIIDVADPAPPSSPVGGATISMNSALENRWSGTTRTGQAALSTGAGNRNYQIASSGGDLNGWFVNETATIQYSGLPNAIVPAMFQGVTTALGTPSIALTVNGLSTMTAVNVGSYNGGAAFNPTVTPVAAAWTNNGVQYTLSASGSSLILTAKTPLPTLSLATTNPVAGIGWAVGFTSSIGIQAGPGSGDFSQTYSFHYDAYISNI